ncbi:MAG: exo-alpha-sialidase [Draconibacterium sp.]
MRIIKQTELLFLLFAFWASINACTKTENNPDIPIAKDLTAEIITSQEKMPVLTGKAQNMILLFQLKVNSPSKYAIKNIRINFEGTTNINDIENVRLSYIGEDSGSLADRQFGETTPGAASVIFSDNLNISQPTAFFKVFVKLNEVVDLSHLINATCETIETDAGIVKNTNSEATEGLRLGVALRKHGDDNVDTYRIPGLTTTNNGTLLAIYDARHETSRDLQGNIDIGLNRSTDGGQTWEPMQIVLDRGTWGGLPEKFNGISDACILVDKNTNNIFIAGLWMHGVIDSNGKWVEGLTEASSDWNHQWRNKGSQPGFDIRETSQFLVTKSTDDGQTWSEPVNLTEMCKKEYWWLWAPAPGHGITLNDGTLVFPTQGRDANGNSFSNITWSSDSGETWTTSNFASQGTTENMVVQLSDGSIMLNARDGSNKGNTSNTNGRVISTTNNLGQTWTSHSTSRSALIEPGCMASLHKHKYTENGKEKSILFFSNPSSKTNRDHMTIKISLDDGQTWPEKYWILLDEKAGRGYSCLTTIDENTIGILYEGSQADMVFQKIKIDEILSK